MSGESTPMLCDLGISVESAWKIVRKFERLKQQREANAIKIQAAIEASRKKYSWRPDQFQY